MTVAYLIILSRGSWRGSRRKTFGLQLFFRKSRRFALAVTPLSPISFPMEMATLYPLYTSSHTNRVEYSVTNDVETRPQGRPIIDRLSLDRRYSSSTPTLLTLGSASYPPTHINTIDSPLSRDLAACPFSFFFFTGLLHTSHRITTTFRQP